MISRQLFTRQDLRDFLGEHYRWLFTMDNPRDDAIGSMLRGNGYTDVYSTFDVVRALDRDRQWVRMPTDPWLEAFQRQAKGTLTGQAALGILDSIPED